MSKTTIDTTKEQLVKDFRKRLTEAYGYRDGQIAQDILIQSGQTADIAIWRSEEARRLHQIPDICVVVVCKAEHIRIQADEYISHLNTSSIETSIIAS